MPTRDRWRRLGAALARGIPDLPAETVGFFRMVYAALLFGALDARRLRIGDGFVAGDPSLHWSWVNWWVSRPEAVTRLEDVILASLVVFGIGLFTRVAYAVVVAGLTLWVVIMLQQDTNLHVWEVALLTVVCLVPVPWGAAFSLDETIRRWRGRGYGPGLRGRHFGYAVWMPGFILGAFWLGAAYSKFEDSGLDWMLGGAVKYHWVIDADQAAVDWGLWVASHHWAAVLMSALGVLLETTFILAVFARTTLVRTVLATAIGGSLLAGFYLFHGVAWWPWMIVLICFAVPWQAVYVALSSLVPQRTWKVDLSQPREQRRARLWHGLDWFNTMTFVDPANRPVRLDLPDRVPKWGPLRPAHVVLPLVICVLMIREWPESFGRFTAYANTYASIEAFNAEIPYRQIDRLWIGFGTSAAVELLPSADVETMIESVDHLKGGGPLPATHSKALGRIGERLARDYGDARVTLVREYEAFDWQAGRFIIAKRGVIGSLDVPSMALIPEVPAR